VDGGVRKEEVRNGLLWKKRGVNWGSTGKHNHPNHQNPCANKKEVIKGARREDEGPRVTMKKVI